MFDWKKDLISKLPKGKGSVKAYGRSNDEKFNTIMKSIGANPNSFKALNNASQYESARLRTTLNPGSQKIGYGAEDWDKMFNIQPSSPKPNKVEITGMDRFKHLLGIDLSKTKEQAIANENKTNTNPNKERTGFLGGLDRTVGRMSNTAIRTAFGNEFANAQNENYKKLAADELKQNPKDKSAIQTLQMLNAQNRPAKNKVEKASDFIGNMAGVMAPYTVGGAYGASDYLLGKVGLNSIKTPIVQDLVRGLGAGAIAGGERATTKKVASNEKVSAKDIALESLLAGGGDAAAGAILRNLNLKGQIDTLMKQTGSNKFNAEELQKAIHEAYGQKGNPVNVLANQTKELPKPFETKYNLKPNKSMDNFTTNEIPKVEMPKVLDWQLPQFNTPPKARIGEIPNDVGKYGKENISNQVDNILQRADALSNPPDGGFNQRLLDIQKEMKSVNDKRAIYRQPLSPDELYLKVRKPNDPKTFDDLIKLAEMEHNASNAPKNIKTLLSNDTKVNEGIKRLNEVLGVKPKEIVPPKPDQPNVSSLDEMLKFLNDTPKSTVNNNGKTLVQALQEINTKYKGAGPDKQQEILNEIGKAIEQYTPHPNDLGKNVTIPIKNPLEALKPVKQVEKNISKQNIISSNSGNTDITNSNPEDGHGLIDTQAKGNEPKPIEFRTFKPNKNPQEYTHEELVKIQDNLLKQKNILGSNTTKEAAKQLKAVNSDINKVKKIIKDKQQEEINQLLSNSDNWKDKGKFLLGRETMDRNFQDVMGADAPTFIKKFLDPIKNKEAERIRFLNKEREQVKSYGIKPKSLDDKLVQLYGEKKITLDELKQRTPNWEKVAEVADKYRAKYDELLNQVNKVLRENGFDEIPKRKDYFPHYEEVDGLMKQLGFDMENHSLPTDINGLTDDFRPNKQFFRNALQRKGDQTTYGAVQGFDKYIEGISNVIYHTQNIKQLRSLDKAIRAKYPGQTNLSNFAAQLTEYTNVLAGKKSRVDRSIEDTFGRRIYNAVETLRRRTGANMIGANVSSAMTNFIPLTHSLATTDKMAFVKGLTDTLKNVVKNDGFVQESNFLTKRVGSDPLYRTMWDKTIDKSMWLMRTVDNFTSQVITRSKFNELISKGMAPEEAMKQADDWAGKIMADRSKGGMPTLFNSKTFGILSQFQLEVNNQVSFLLKDLPRNIPNKAALASAVGQILIYSYLFNNLYEKAVGRRPALDPIGIAFQAEKDYNNPNLTKGKATQNLTGNILNNLPFTSIVNGGRYPISAGIPNVNDAMGGRSTWKKELIKPLLYLGMPTAGGQVKKAYEGLAAMNLNPLSPQGATGVYSGDKLKIPVQDNAQNKIRGALFGQYSFPETKAYYDNNQTALSPLQTKAYERLNKQGHGKEVYNFFKNPNVKTYEKGKVTSIEKDKTLSNEEKIARMMKLLANAKKQ